jgi:uncharacterized membrane protein
MYSKDDWDPGRMMDGSYGNGMNGGGAWMMAIFGLLILALMGTTIFVALKAAGSHATNIGPRTGPVGGSPRDVLDMRLAKGEVTPEEYGQTKTLLDE